MVAASGTLMSPTRASRVGNDCKPHTCSASHTLASLGSPSQARAPNLNKLASPPSRRAARTCSALPFGFPLFGFPQFGSPYGTSQNSKIGTNGSDGERIRREGGSSGGYDAATDMCGATGGSAAATGPFSTPIYPQPTLPGPTQQPQQTPQQLSARRRLNLPSLTSNQSNATTSSTAAGVEALPAPETQSDEWPRPSQAPGIGTERQQQSPERGGSAGSAGRGGGRRGSPLPYPWRLSGDEEEEVAGGAAAAGLELDMTQLPQLLAEWNSSSQDSCWNHTQHAILAGGHGAAERERELFPEATAAGNIPSSNSSSLSGHPDLGRHSSMPAGSPTHGSRPGGGCGGPRRPAEASLVRRQRRQQLQEALLDRLHTDLAAGKLQPVEVLPVPGLLPFLTEAMGVAAATDGLYGGERQRQGVVSERGVSASTGVALECLCTLLSEDSLPALARQPHLERPLVEAVEAAVRVLRSARLPSGVNAPSHNPTPPAAAAAGACAAPGAAFSSWAQTAGGGGDGGDAADSWADGTSEAYGWSADVSAAFFAASVLVRAARVPVLAEAAVAAGGLALLVRLMGCRPAMLAQMAVFATYKLVRQSLHPPSGGGTAAAAYPTQQPSSGSGFDSAERQRQWQEAALLAVAQAGGVGALCGCLQELPDRPSRDMASSLLLDMALVAAVPAVVAGLGQVAALVGVMGSRRCDASVRMYGLLVLARLCNQSAECQMDAVREGAVEPLLSLVRRGGEEEQTHACRLLAILAQAVPTHGRMKAVGVVPAVLPLLGGGGAARGSAAVVAEHAVSVLAVLAQNPDMHFHIVGAGAVPALMPLLSSGTEKARTYVLACLMLLCEQEERHAAVVVRAGALPTLVAMVAGPAPPPAMPAAAATAALAAAAAAAAAATTASQPQQRSAASTQEFATAVVCALSRYVDVQAELQDCGALLALVRCLSRGPAEASINAAEALAHVATGDAAAKRAIAGDTAAAAALLRMLTAAKPAARYWALQLLRTVSTDDTAFRLAARLSPPPAEEEGGAAAAASRGLRPGGTEHAAELVSALVRLLRWAEPEGQPVSWQQGRCRVLAGWMLARMCGLAECSPLLLAGGAVRELMAVLAEEQQRTAAAAAARDSGGEAQWGAMVALPLLPGEGNFGLGVGGDDGGSDSGTERDVDEKDAGGMAEGSGGGGGGGIAWPQPSAPAAAGGSMDMAAAPGAAGGGGGGSYPRRTRFDMNAAAAATAALLAVARTGREGRTAVMAELALVHWMGTAVQLDELGRP